MLQGQSLAAAELVAFLNIDRQGSHGPRHHQENGGDDEQFGERHASRSHDATLGLMHWQWDWLHGFTPRLTASRRRLCTLDHRRLRLAVKRKTPVTGRLTAHTQTHGGD